MSPFRKRSVDSVSVGAQAGRQDLIGSGCDCLIPSNPPREAIEARRQQANRAAQRGDDHYHTVANPTKGEPAGERGLPNAGKNKGYRPGRKSQQRQQGKKKRKGSRPQS